jgi:hypothetical protein
LRRQRWLVLVGLNLSLALALLSYARISSDGLSPRGAEVWQDEATLAFSTSDSPELRSTLGPQAQPERYPGLVDLYAAFATSDDVVAALRKQGLLTKEEAESGKPPIAALAVPSAVNGAPTQLLKVSATGPTPARAKRMTLAATQQLLRYVTARQVAAKIPVDDRVQLRILKESAEPTLLVPRNKSKTILVFLACLTATVAAAFIRDNIQRSRSRPAGQLTTLPIVEPPRFSPEARPSDAETRERGESRAYPD